MNYRLKITYLHKKPQELLQYFDEVVRLQLFVLKIKNQLSLLSFLGDEAVSTTLYFSALVSAKSFLRSLSLSMFLTFLAPFVSALYLLHLYFLDLINFVNLEINK